MKKKPHDFSKPKSLVHYLRLVLTGFAMGAADIVPGVSGGTMAFILGVYSNLLDAIKSFNMDAIRMLFGLRFKDLIDHVSLRFLLALGAGLFSAILLLSSFLSATMDDPGGRILLFAFFFGLVLASILTIGVKVRWTIASVLTFITGTVIAFVIVNIVPAEANHSAPALFVSGMIASCAMILPGISGSFILLILGQYDFILSAVSDRSINPIVIIGSGSTSHIFLDFNQSPVFTVACGAVVGIIAFSRVLSYLLTNYYNRTVALLVGFMAGSLWKIYPWKRCVNSDLDRHLHQRCLLEQNIAPDTGSETFAVALTLLIVGFLLVNLLDHLQSRENPIFRLFLK